ncbi:Protein CBR-NRDE-4 [Caenorhabditis briggsae]|uniref:Protein CBR-NRDE-4 n=1 Tax=Caenorhabditis briggsae TaxID=6238 RepID=A8X1B0_CAEBR|nr:Protein CBR-NRDE-4 [Caenorhabditis briggsae]CAP26420.2 Protein CBR-NRDE-4 [Caenorhabditis briggsae]
MKTLSFFSCFLQKYHNYDVQGSVIRTVESMVKLRLPKLRKEQEQADRSNGRFINRLRKLEGPIEKKLAEAATEKESMAFFDHLLMDDDEKPEVEILSNLPGSNSDMDYDEYQNTWHDARSHDDEDVGFETDLSTNNFLAVVGRFYETEPIEEVLKGTKTEKELDAMTSILQFISLEEEKTLPSLDEPLAKVSYNEPAVRAILLSDETMFYREYVKRIDSNGNCTQQCICKIHIPIRVRYKTPLHLAAAVSNETFVKNTCSKEEGYVQKREMHIMKEFEMQKKISDFVDCVEHFEELMRNWSYNMSYTDSMLAAENALEHGRVEAFFEMNGHEYQDAMISYHSKEKPSSNDHLVSYLQGLFQKFSIFGDFSKCFCFLPSTLSRIVCLSNMDSFDDRLQLSEIINTTTHDKQLYAINMAAYNGDVKTLRYLEDHNLSVFEQKEYNDEDYHNTLLESPAAHILAQYGHYDGFNSLTEEEKRVEDKYGFCALVSMLQFTDDQIMQQMRLFMNMKRENLFMFIAECIVKNRRELTMFALKCTFANKGNFTTDELSRDRYTHYGLPGDIPLPMETALSRIGDIDFLEKIVMFYASSEVYAEKVKREDAFRCIESIQGSASQCSEQVRLAIILMMMNFVPPRSKRFVNIMRMYLGRGENDPVAVFFLQNYTLSKCRPSRVKWEDAFEQGRVAVSGWNGTIEESQRLENINLKKGNKKIAEGDENIGKGLLKNRLEEKPRTSRPKTANDTMHGIMEAFRLLNIKNC